ncbi:MAG: hypothetical protein MK097_17005, partial [Dechloromonas sp.]|nr:hypothetical protein [Dechloromonas sp.]
MTEAPDSPTYQTILATWEEDSPLGPSDWFTPTPPPPLPATVDAPRGDALPLPVGQTAQAQTVKDGAPVWYLLPAAESATPQLRVFTLSAPELVEVGLRLETLDGTDIPLTLVSDPQDIPPSPRPDGWLDQVQFAAEVDPTQPLLLRVAEEGRLMIVRRERTNMLSRVEIQRKRAYEDLADLLGDGFDAIDVGIPTPNGETLLKGRDNILLGMHRLIDPNSDQAVGTTDFGTVVTDAADTIRAWPGGKALVYFGMGGGMMQVADMDWLPAVQDTPVRTISIFAPCDLGNFFCPDDAVAELNPMTFAAATRGDFHRVTNKSAIAEAFAAAATSMTGPKPFAIAWQDTDLPPEPATLMLTLSPADKARAEDIAAAGGNPAPPALSLILDASGSMLRREDGTRRITLARDALTRLVRETIPDGTQVSYRAFGLAKDACNTRAFAPLGQL